MTKQLFRSASLLFIFNLSFITGKAQWVSIPDTNLGTWLNSYGYSQCLQGNNTLGWQMDTTCNTVVNATQVYCSSAYITDLTGIQYFDNLVELDCTDNQLTWLPDLPNTLRVLLCSNNHLSSLPTLPNGLTDLICELNQITSLPFLPNSLTTLLCKNNFLTNLPSLPNSLTTLVTSSQPISNLPTLPNSLTMLICVDNQLSNLPSLPSSLDWLECGFNHIAVLPTLPSNLTTLRCNSNPLGSLPVLPSGLTMLECDNNQLTYLPSLPNSIAWLVCSQNQLTTLPTLPINLHRLDCGSNLLTSLPILPDSLSQLFCSNNPSIFCLPELKKVVSFMFSNTGITCLPNYPQSNSYSNPPLSNYPLCDTSSFNIYGCGGYWNITGKIYQDTNINCLYDAGENTFTNLKVQLYESGVLKQQNYIVNGGIYSFDTQMGTYTMSVDTTGIPFDILCPASRFDTSVITALDSFDYDKDFALQCKPGFDVGAWSLVSNSVFRPAHIEYISIHAGDWAEFWGQNCNTNNLSGQVVTTISGAATFVSAAAGALSPTVSGNILTYNISNWSAVNPNTDFNIIVQTDTNAALGSQICFDVNVTPAAGDNNPTNNTLTHCFTVVGSYDPNEKEVSPVNNVSAGDWLTYTVHFQNTGTATAEHIYVTDTLDSNVDASSFQLLDFSHQPKIEIKDKAVRFNFPNINLPDSNANEALSHGYVQYRVKLKNNLQVGTPISNTAFIYFDFNSPVVTNTTSNTITTTTSIENFEIRNADFGLHPNPASESVRVSVDESMVGSNLTITDITGRRLLTVSVANSTFSISTAAFSSGVYFVRIGNATVSGTKKLVVKQQ